MTVRVRKPGLILAFVLDLHVLELREDAVGVVALLLPVLFLIGRDFGLRRGFGGGRFARGQQGLARTASRLRGLLALALGLAGCLLNGGVEVDLRAESEGYGIDGLDVRRVPVAAVADRLDEAEGALCGLKAEERDQLADLLRAMLQGLND